MFPHNRCPIPVLRIDGRRWRAAGHHSQIIFPQPTNIPPLFRQIVTWTSALLAGMVLVEPEAILGVVCVEENKMSPLNK